MAWLPSETHSLESPIPIFVLPITDYAKFVAQLQPEDTTGKITQVHVRGKPMSVCQRGDFAVLTGAECETADQGRFGVGEEHRRGSVAPAHLVGRSRRGGGRHTFGNQDLQWLGREETVDARSARCAGSAQQGNDGAGNQNFSAGDLRCRRRIAIGSNRDPRG